ncbi:HIT family protein [Solwaraspora sp. WMMB335]|uniref:HIT family protein n=1 Tax=Solwaraspora sp. WMMB335 TaxID=3404118 RepID=UPI003B925ED6
MDVSDDPSVDCLFCRRDDPQLNRISHQNLTCFARLDNFPATEGHTEIVPKRHVESFFDLTPQELQDAYALILTVRTDLARRLRPQGYTIGINEGRAAGRSIDHLHIHVIPRRFGDVEDPAGGIRQVLPNCDPQAWTAATAAAFDKPDPLLR